MNDNSRPLEYGQQSEQRPPAGAFGSATGSGVDDARARRRAARTAGPPSSFQLPPLPTPDLDGELLSYAIEVELKDEVSRIDPVVKKRASNVLKLAEENSRLTAELKALSDRLEAAERKKLEKEEADAAAAAEAESAQQDDYDGPPPLPAKDTV